MSFGQPFGAAVLAGQAALARCLTASQQDTELPYIMSLGLRGRRAADWRWRRRQASRG